QKAHARPELLSEEVLDLERSAALRGIDGVERWLGLSTLQGLDDQGRVADRLALELELEHRERPGSGEPPRDPLVTPGDRRPPDVRDALVIQRPARLLVVVGDLQV